MRCRQYVGVLIERQTSWRALQTPHVYTVTGNMRMLVVKRVALGLVQKRELPRTSLKVPLGSSQGLLMV